MAKVAVLFLTPKCNMHCDFCGASAEFDPIPVEKARDLIDRLAFEHFQSIVFGGGEPFLWKGDLVGISDYARKRGMVSQVGTNATLAPAADDSILKAFDRWILPMESMNPEIHDLMRPFEGGHLRKVGLLLERLRSRKVEATISSLVSKENFDQLLELGQYLSWYQRHGGKIHAWHLYRFLPLGRGGSLHAERYSVDENIFRTLGELLRERFRDLQIYLRPDMYHSREVSFFWWQDARLKSMQAMTAV